MKTIFKRPLFVNPQAYTVIPELYSIDKLLSFNFDENDTYTTKLVYNGRVESIIKKAGEEYILHLDLYTVDGSCVLGEWYVKGIDSESVVTIDKNILTIVANNNLKYPGLIAAWSAKGKTNDDADRNILKDLTGNGHDITLNNFAFSGMSGYGGYKTIWLWWTNTYALSVTNTVLKSYIRGNNLLISYIPVTKLPPSFKVKITGLQNGDYLEIGNAKDLIKLAEVDGIYIIDINAFKEQFPNQPYLGIKLLSKNIYPINKNIITIELLPEYPDALVFDGVDDYGINESIKDVLNGSNEYTVIAKRKYINITKDKTPVFSITSNVSTMGTLFLFEYYSNSPITSNKGVESDVMSPNEISWQTNETYNQQYIASGTNTTVNGFVIGRFGGNIQYVTVALYSYYIFNRTLTDQEIKSFIRKHIDPEYLLPSEIPATTLISNDTLIDNSTLIKNN